MTWLYDRKRMSRAVVVFGVAANVIFGSVGAAPTPSDLSVTNHATLAIAELYVSATDDDAWGNNRVATSIAPGQSFRLPTMRTRGCRVDIRAVFANGSVEDKRGLDSCHARQVIFDASNAITPPSLAQSHAVRHVLITNHTSRAIVEMYVSSAASDEWGEDLVAHHPISQNNSGEIKPDISCQADLRVVFDNRSAEERRDLDLCAHARVDIRPGWTTNEDAPSPAPSAHAKPGEP